MFEIVYEVLFSVKRFLHRICHRTRTASVASFLSPISPSCAHYHCDTNGTPFKRCGTSLLPIMSLFDSLQADAIVAGSDSSCFMKAFID